MIDIDFVEQCHECGADISHAGDNYDGLCEDCFCAEWGYGL